jgi:hypothetical protein
MEHVAFAIRSVDASGGVGVEISITYTAADSFVEISPPVGEAGATTVTFTPRSRTVGAQVYLMPGYEPAAGIAVAMSQQHGALTRAASCDFGSEINCVGGVAPNQTVTVSLTGGGPNTKVALVVAWA